MFSLDIEMKLRIDLMEIKESRLIERIQYNTINTLEIRLRFEYLTLFSWWLEDNQSLVKLITSDDDIEFWRL